MDHCNNIGRSVRYGYSMAPKKRSSLVGAIAPVLVSIILVSSCRTCLGEEQVNHPQSKLAFGQEDETSAAPTNLPRILTVLTTYNQRTQYIKAYREVAANRTDGYEPLIFVTSDEDDTDPDGVVDYKFGKPRTHRLVAALREATSKYSGQFDWVALGDDDTVFMYKRAMALLRHIDPKQPIAIGMVHGACEAHLRKRGVCECFSPEERSGEFATSMAVNGCCLDITQPCEVPIVPDPNMSGSSMKTFLRNVRTYNGNLYWPYGGTGFFMSAGLAETIQANNDGWEVCREMFGRYHTDMQVGRCLVANGYTMSSFNTGFYRPGTANVELIRDHLASECQIIGVHAGFRHLEDGREYTTDTFKTTLSTIWDEDAAQPWLSEGSLETECPQTWATISRWM